MSRRTHLSPHFNIESYYNIPKSITQSQIHEIVHFKNDLLKGTVVDIYVLNATHKDLAKISSRKGAKGGGRRGGNINENLNRKLMEQTLQ